MTGTVVSQWVGYSALLAACIALAAVALEPMAAARRWARRAPWALALVLATILPLAVALRPGGEPQQRSHDASSSRFERAWSAAPEASLDRWTLILWGLASAALVARLVAASWQLQRAARRSILVELDGVAVALTEATGPGARCFGTPRILVPTWILTVEPKRRAMLIRHEWEHVRSGDPLLVLSALVATAAMPWNPALWFIARRLSQALELDCDARVLGAIGDVRGYGELLLTVAAGRQRTGLAPYLPFASAPSTLDRRIRAIAAPHPSLGARQHASLALVLLGATLVAGVARAPSPIAPLLSSASSAEHPVRPRTSNDTSNDTSKDTNVARTNDEVRRLELDRELREHVAASILATDANEPLLVTYSADGRVVYARRMPARAPGAARARDDFPFPASEIASVDVDKSPLRLPSSVRGGMVRVVLKPSVVPAPTGRR